MNDSFFGIDKLQHVCVLTVAAYVDEKFAMGLALGKEYGDKKAVGNHWCWKDLVADMVGIVIGSTLRRLTDYYLGT